MVEIADGTAGDRPRIQHTNQLCSDKLIGAHKHCDEVRGGNSKSTGPRALSLTRSLSRSLASSSM